MRHDHQLRRVGLPVVDEASEIAQRPVAIFGLTHIARDVQEDLDRALVPCPREQEADPLQERQDGDRSQDVGCDREVVEDREHRPVGKQPVEAECDKAEEPEETDQGSDEQPAHRQRGGQDHHHRAQAGERRCGDRVADRGK